MTTIANSTTLGTAFTPDVGYFAVQATLGTKLIRSLDGTNWSLVDYVGSSNSLTVNNPSNDIQYKFEYAGTAIPVVSASQSANAGTSPVSGNVVVTNFPAINNQVIQLLALATTTGPGPVFAGFTPCTFSAQGNTASGTGTAVIDIEVRIGTAWELLETITLTLSTTVDVASFPNPSGMYTGVRANVRTITGTSAAVDAFMGY